ncbi:hypothetical protein [Streptomyces sp. NPDC058424]|uniref:hypothetical protein n=1 Tax=Streptomyces sp. NPDC058424 TaxID=3346491 RepID=UPI003649E853
MDAHHRGKASGANNTVREIGGALGTAVLSSVFVHYGSPRGPQDFVDGMRPAIWIGVAVVLVGALCALAIPRTVTAKRTPAAEEQENERTRLGVSNGHPQGRPAQDRRAPVGAVCARWR